MNIVECTAGLSKPVGRRNGLYWPVSATFIVGSDGVVYEKDLGKETAIAKAMKQYDPDARWHRADVAQAETAGDQNIQ